MAKEVEEKVMMALTSVTVRGIVNAVNDRGIKKEDIVSLLKEKEQFVLIYYN